MLSLVYKLIALWWISTVTAAEIEVILRCTKECIRKIPSEDACSRCCKRLGALAGNDTGQIYIPPVPDVPRFISNTYTNITVKWTTTADLHGRNVLYIVEIDRKRFIKDPIAVLPDYQKYHVVPNSSFTTPILESKTNYTMRVAAVGLHGTRGFSSFTPNLRTNNDCKALYNDTSKIEDLCAVSNLRLRITAEVYFDPNVNSPKQRTSVWIDWDSPPESHRIPADTAAVQVEPLTKPSLLCSRHGTYHVFLPKFRNFIHLNKTDDDDKSFYMGCKYRLKFKLRNMIWNSHLVWTAANFTIPECVGGICACKIINWRDKPIDELSGPSKYIKVVKYEPINATKSVVTLTWDELPWKGKAIFFRISVKISFRTLSKMKYCNIRQQDFFVNLTNKVSVGTQHNVTFTGTKLKECPQYIVIKGYSKMGCQVPHREVLVFTDYLVSTAQTTISGNGSLVTEPPTTLANVGRLGHSNAKQNKSLIAVAIVVPLIVLLLVIFLVLLYVYKRLKSKPVTLPQTPTGLQRRDNDSATVRFELSHVYHRNVDTESVFSTNEQTRLLVNLPPKCVNGGLELNPAYVEQQIQEAIKSGETDDYEFGFHRLVMGRKIGKGAFGHVFIADAYGINGNPDKTVVAVKVLKDKASPDEKEDFRAEINFMKLIGKHENIITILGCCTLYEPVCLLVEYAPHGDLLHYLRDLRKKFETEKRKCLYLKGEPATTNNKPDPQSLTNSPSTSRAHGSPTNRQKSLSVSNLGRELLAIFSTQRRNSKEIDLLYVGRNEESTSILPRSNETTLQTNQTFQTTLTELTNKKGIAHSTPALVSLDGALDSSELESFAYQISCGMNFLSSKGVLHRDLAARNILVGEGKVLKISDFGLSREGVYVKRSNGKIPLRWLSLEAIRDRIYSMASDVWAFGIVLWEICTLGGFPYPTVNDRDLLQFLMDGQRMEKPTNCTDEIYQIMLACWSTNPEDRPSFQVLKDLLVDMEKSERPYVNVDPSQEISLPPDEGHVGNLIRFSDNSSGNFLNTDKCTPANSENNDDTKNKAPLQEFPKTEIKIDDHSEEDSGPDVSNNNTSHCEITIDSKEPPTTPKQVEDKPSSLELKVTDEIDESVV